MGPGSRLLYRARIQFMRANGGVDTICMSRTTSVSRSRLAYQAISNTPFHREKHSYGIKPRVTNQSSSISQSSKHNAELQALQRVDELLSDALKPLQSPTAPDEVSVVESLETCQGLAKYLKSIHESPNGAEEVKSTPAMNLLFLDEQGEAHGTSHSAVNLAAAIRNQAVERLSDTAYQIVVDPKVFISPQILEIYVNIQSLLGRPETLSQVMSLYANKPIPKPESAPIQYTAANPASLAAAVPIKIANEALTAAIQSKNLPLCLDIINTTVCATAFRRTKIFKRALIPLLGFSLAPLAAYTLASQISVYQDTMTPEMATNVAFAGILAYVMLTGTIGVVAVTTANDQMDRVTWATGTPLRERWLREEERAMIDRVAGAWGFKETWRRGEEEGPDWAALREFTGLRGMVLDRVALMEGME
ncbi:hypothetical protein MMC26_000947 [Xylographa opegraphella]|nr:hypothetical protein [Xylographa opegraphella]